MPHIHTLPGQHDHTVSAYIIRYIDDVPHLLLHRHKKYRTLMQPGGHVELNENPWQAILHELPEETGYDATQLAIFQPVVPTFLEADNTAVLPLPFLINSHRVKDGTVEDHYHDDSVYVFLADGLPNSDPAQDESQELRWLSADEIATWDDEDMTFGVKKITNEVMSSCIRSWHPVSVSIYRQKP